MSYLALARKWRPRIFADVMGQGHVVKALTHALDGDRLHPAILLTGTRGVGKTTLARIVAKGLNCETGVSASPCGICSACGEVDAGRFVDLLEIDAASHTGVENVRELIDNSQYAPARGRYKVYLIDEVHMLSRSAFNALLKTLEDPPPQLKFILATTDPQKLPVTVLSRCLQFNLRRLPLSVIRDQLARVLEQEGIDFEPAAVAEIARAADGSMRDGLSLLDQAIAFSGGGPLERSPIEDMLGTAGRQVLYSLLQAVAARDGAALVQGIAGLDARAPDHAALLNELAAILQRVAVLQVLAEAQSDDDDEELLALVPALAAEDVQLYYQIAVHGRRDLPYAPDPRSGFEMTLLRMLAFRIDDGAPGGRQRDMPVAATRAGSPDTRRPGAAAPSAVPAVLPTAAPAVTPVVTPAVSSPLSPPSPVPEVDPRDLPWAERIDTLGLGSQARQLARQCAWVGEQDDRIHLRLDAAVRFLIEDDNGETRRRAIEQAFSDQLGRPLRVHVEVAAAELAPTPAQLDQQRAQQQQQAREAAIRNDPAVLAFKDQFGAAIRPGSIRPES